MFTVHGIDDYDNEVKDDGGVSGCGEEVTGEE